MLLQQKNYNRLTRDQYVDLNMRIQKSLILDFDENSARQSAEQDWKIDLERENADKDTGIEEEEELDSDADSEQFRERDARVAQKEHDRIEKLSAKGVEYERLCEFFFDLCLSWCQHLDIETFLFFVNGVFLNITRGQHINVSVLRDLEDIPVLSIEFFNHLLAHRQQCQDRANMPYADWYTHNF